MKGSTRSVTKVSLLAGAGIEPFIVSIDAIGQVTLDFLQSQILIIAITSKDITHFKELLKAIDKSPIEKVLFISSTAVYPSRDAIVTEETEIEPLNPLGVIENLFMTNSKMKATVIRFAGLFGYDRKPGNFFRLGKTIVDPEGYANMIHRDDCIALIKVILEQEAWGEIFNGCADSHPTKREFYTKAARDIGMPEPSFERSSGIAFKIVSNNKIKEQLGFICTFNELMAINFAAC